MLLSSLFPRSLLVCRLAALPLRRSSRCVPNSGSFIVPPDVNIVAAANLPQPSASCIIEIVQKDSSTTDSHPKVQHADGQPLRITVSRGSDLRRCVSHGLQLAAQFKANSTIALSFGNQPFSDSDAATAAEAVSVHAYSPSTWKNSHANQKPVVQNCTIVDASPEAVQLGHDVGTAINMARRLGDLPPNVATPAYMASHALQLCEPSPGAAANLTCTVLDERDCASLGMNLLLAVGSGSLNPPRVVALDYCPPGLELTQPVLLVGKGVTFDSGGISIKPSAKMEVYFYCIMQHYCIGTKTQPRK
jgi:leucyl aminopeptidase